MQAAAEVLRESHERVSAFLKTGQEPIERQLTVGEREPAKR
jgi:hypothetical protein